MATASLRIDLDGKDVAALATLGLLAEGQRGDRDAVKAALLELAGVGFRTLKAGK
jgi:hypothetical protein